MMNKLSNILLWFLIILTFALVGWCWGEDTTWRIAHNCPTGLFSDVQWHKECDR